jgi:DNA invertase Pin-like site-specific DNA recombinase
MTGRRPRRYSRDPIYDEYVDAGESGKDLDRPELKRLLADVKSGGIHHIKVTKLDRITRSLRDFCELKDLFDKHRVSFNSLEDKFDTTTPMGEAMVNIVMVFAELERKMTSQRTKETMVSRAEQGLHNGGRIWGYKLNPDRRGVLLIDEEEARTIRRIFKKYLEVKSLTQLQRWMQRESVLRPEVTSRRKRKSGGTVPTVTGLRTLLQNPVYIGQRQTAKGRSSRESRKQSSRRTALKKMGASKSGMLSRRSWIRAQGSGAKRVFARKDGRTIPPTSTSYGGLCTAAIADPP